MEFLLVLQQCSETPGSGGPVYLRWVRVIHEHLSFVGVLRETVGNYSFN